MVSSDLPGLLTPELSVSRTGDSHLVIPGAQDSALCLSDQKIPARCEEFAVIELLGLL